MDGLPDQGKAVAHGFAPFLPGRGLFRQGPSRSEVRPVQPSLDVAVTGRLFHHGLGAFPGPVVDVGRRVQGHRGVEVLSVSPQSRPQVLPEPPVAGDGSGQDDQIDLVDAELLGVLLLVTVIVVIAVAFPGGLPGRLVPLVRFLELPARARFAPA